MVVPGAQSLLRDQIVQSSAPISKQGQESAMLAAVSHAEEAFPKHILMSKLLGGMRVIKHGII